MFSDSDAIFQVDWFITTLTCLRYYKLLFLFLVLITDDICLVTKIYVVKYVYIQIRENDVLVTRKMIGSRPPRCERKCRNCGHCKAVQVPIAPFLKRSHKLYAANSRGDDLANYKPMCWKCQCGDSLFNP